ncbi:MAG TPA: EAL domain-containing protein, partial [Candidatus Competibacteraceae bacterium]|nr:EAL domain-containing protein [Candidatus Competibacteraceae bacterium]
MGNFPLVPNQRRFFSLKWKALLFTSLVLVAVTMAISLRGYINLNTRFDRYRQAAHARYERDIQALVEQSLNRLRELGSMMPSLPKIQQGLASGNLADIQAAFQPQWPVLQLGLGINVVAFYTTSGDLLATWETMAWNQGHNPQILQWVKQVNQAKLPVTAVNCDPADCIQYAVVPILAEGHSVGALLIGNSLADVVRNFRQLSGNDIGLLVSSIEHPDGDPGRWLPSWKTQVIALTNPEQNLPVLQRLAALYPSTSATAGGRTTVNGHSYEAIILPMPRLVGGYPAHLAIIADITAQLQEIRQATKEIAIGGVTGWLLSELLLLLILWMPMSRLRQTAANLPLLAQRQFQRVRAAIGEQSRRHFLDDETDILNITTVTLADRLEELEEQVAERTKALARRMNELAKERDFSASLLDLAQVMIVTQDRRGRIIMVNTYTRTVTGYREDELVGRDFFTALFAEGAAVRQRIREELASDQHKHLRHESLITGKNGAIRNITWFHSRLLADAPEDPEVLSVGLDITERLGAESRLAWLSDHDTLTGLLNRRRFQEELELVLTAARRHDKTGALLFIDLDHFKYINDTSGHHIGDALLKAVGKVLSNQIEVADVVARLDGDEFAVLVRDTDPEGAVHAAADIQHALHNLSFIAGNQMLQISVSIGIVLFPLHADTIGDLMASADLAVFQAKEEGRGHWHLFSKDDATRERLRNRIYWRDKVSKALAEDRFLFYFQPIMEIRNRQVSHYEVLLRMRDDDGGIIGPSHFVDAAARGGMINALDRMVISNAVRFLAELSQYSHNLAFAINLSGYAFNDPQLLPHLQQELQSHQVDPSKVIFEITETAAVSDFAVANSLMLAIKELGCRFALDDFGIGFSSFYYLKHLPVDYLKIDGSFIRHLADSLDDQAIVQAMSQVALQFGKKTIAEFVDTE